jgi:hypothetical protein
MDETDVLFRVKNSFYLGNFKSVLDIWKEVVQTGVKLSPKIEEQVGSLIQRMAIIYLRKNENVGINIISLFRRTRKSSLVSRIR